MSEIIIALQCAVHSALNPSSGSNKASIPDFDMEMAGLHSYIHKYIGNIYKYSNVLQCYMRPVMLACF